jgi:phosphoribosylformylglycinamidine synthase
MGFGGHCGLKVDLTHKSGTPVDVLFAEELGWVLEVGPDHIEKVLFEFKKAQVPCFPIGCSSEFGPEGKIEVSVHGETVVSAPMHQLLASWEETSFQLEKRQANPISVTEENQSFKTRTGPTYRLSFNPANLKIHSGPALSKQRVIIGD